MPDVLIPWRPGCRHREAALEWVADRWAGLGHRVIVGHHVIGEWCKAGAVASALAGSTDEVVIVADADVWPANPAAITDAISALDDHGWAIPHHDVHRLDGPATAELIATSTPGPGRAERPYVGFAGGGITVLRRGTYDDCPLDPRFLGWGQEDRSWAIALRCLHGTPWRGTTDLWHLWHPPQQRANRHTGSMASHELERRYANAAKHPDAMRALIEEAK